MPSYVPPKKNDSNGYITYVSLRSQADAKVMQANPTLAAGDVQIAVDDGAPNNLGTLPVVDADFTKRVKVTLSQAETNGDNLTIIFSDAAGAEWCDLTINIQTSTQTLDEIETDVAATHVHAAGAETEATAAHGHASTIDGHITADYGSTEKTCVDLLDDASGGLADIHTDVGTVVGYVDKIDDATDGLTAIKAEVEGLGGAAMRGTDNAALASVCTEARLAELGATNIPADIDAIKAKTDLIGASVALESAGNLAAVKAKTDLIPADITTQLDTNVPAIKAKTDLLPADTATQLDTNIPAIKAKTDLIPADIATQLDTNIPAILADTGTDGVVIPQAQADKVWGTTTRALTDKAGFTISGTKTTLDALNDISTAQVATEADEALADYAPALETTAQDIKAKTGNLPSDPADESLLEAAIASAGTAPQVIRDAMKLAPSVGAPAAESIDKHLDDIPKESFVV